VCRRFSVIFDHIIILIANSLPPTINNISNRYFTEKEVAGILTECADALIRDGGSGRFNDAAHLLLLAGKFARLLTLYNRALASGLCVETGGEEAEERKFWKAASFRFNEEHLKNGRTHVIEVLEAEGQASIAVTFQLLLQVTLFFEICRGGGFGEAWGLMSGLGLFPAREGEMAEKVENFHSRVDTAVKQHFHQVSDVMR